LLAVLAVLAVLVAKFSARTSETQQPEFPTKQCFFSENKKKTCHQISTEIRPQERLQFVSIVFRFEINRWLDTTTATHSTDSSN
jgi:hypothetical protein